MNRVGPRAVEAAPAAGQRQVLTGRPEPQRAPGVHSVADCRVFVAGAQVAVGLLPCVAGKVVELCEVLSQRPNQVRGVNPDVVEERDGAPESTDVVRELGLGVLEAGLEPLRAFAGLAGGVLSVQRLNRVVLDEVKPAANEAVADLEL